MLKELAKRNSIKLKSTYVFSITVLSIITLSINNIYLYFIVFIITFIIYKQYVLLYLAFIIILFFGNNSKNLINIGIVDEIKSNYYVVNNIIYKTKLISEDKLDIGDLIVVNNSSNNKYNNELKNNIKYYSNSYNKLFNFKPKLLIYNHINSFNSNIKASLLKVLYNIYSYDDYKYNIGYGLISYYFFSFIIRKNKRIGFTLLILYSLLFSFNIKYLFIFISYLLNKHINNKQLKFSCKLLIISFININLLRNFSILIPLLININNILDINLDVLCIFGLIESILFGEINILNTLFYKYLLNLQIILFIFSLFVLIFPNLIFIYELLIEFYSTIMNLNISIRGRITYLSLIIIYVFIKKLNVSNKYYQLSFLILGILNPLNCLIFHVDYIDVGQGDSILIQNRFRRDNILIDTGSTYNYSKVKQHLFKNGIYKIDYLIITHDDSDHNGNLDNLLNDFNIENIITDGCDIVIDDINLKYYDLGEFDNDNDNSLVYSLNYDNYEFLFTGDISYIAEKRYIDLYGPYDCDFLKVSHHGSKTGSSKYFVSNVLPNYAFISTNGMYNHPSNETLDTLDNYLVNYFITKNEGNICVKLGKLIDFIKTDNGSFVIIKS